MNTELFLSVVIINAVAATFFIKFFLRIGQDLIWGYRADMFHNLAKFCLSLAALIGVSYTADMAFFGGFDYGKCWFYTVLLFAITLPLIKLKRREVDAARGKFTVYTNKRDGQQRDRNLDWVGDVTEPYSPAWRATHDD